jgi:hypothetical protein
VQRADQIVVAVLRFVVDRGAPLHERHQRLAIEGSLCPGRSGKPYVLGQGDHGAAVAIGHGDERGTGVVGQRQLALFMGFGAGEERLQALLVKALEGEHARPRQKRRVELEGWILGRRADENDGAVLHVGQEGILLRAVEAVDLVDEEQRALAEFAARARGLEHLAEVLDAGIEGGELLEMMVGDLGEEPRHGGLAGPGRSPEDHRAEPPGLDHAAQHALLAEEVILPHDLVERRRAQPIGKRPRRALGKASRLEQGRHHAFHSALNGNAERFAIALEGKAPAAWRAFERRSQILHRGHFVIVDADEDVAALEAKLRRRRILRDVEHDHAGLLVLDAELLGHGRG